LLTLAGSGPATGAAMGDLGAIANGAVAIRGEKVLAVGPTAEIRRAFSSSNVIDARGNAVLPGLIDPHTHLIFAGTRADEFELRLRGATYLEIMAAGGGIMSTVRATRTCSSEELASTAQPRLSRMLANGTTTAEAKSSYGLSTEHELRSLQAIQRLNQTGPVELVPTFMGAHAIPEEYRGRSDAYVDLVVEEMLPAVAGQGQGKGLARFCDVFCDEGAFSLEQTEQVLSAAHALGLGLKVHIDEFAHLGAARLAAEKRAVSAEHLLLTTPVEMRALAGAGVIGVLLPGTPFGLGLDHYADARAMIEAGMAIALATDLNPGTCYCESMPLMMALACRYMRLTPAESLTASTVNAAFAIERGADLGRLSPGYQADVVILDEADYRSLAYRFGASPVQTVIKRGRLVYSRP
jgi:imidazolonepropionase